jgi:cyanoexosortase A
MISMLSKFQNPQYWSLSLLSGLGILYCAILWKADDSAHLGMSLLFITAASSLLWDKRHQLTFQSDRLSQLFGIGVIAPLLYFCYQSPHSAQLQELNPTLRIFPFVVACGVGLIASGAKHLKQYWQELTILFFLGVPSVIATWLPDFSAATAFSAGLLLWYGGFPVTVQDTTIQMPTGIVEVYAGCSGMESMTYLLGVSVVCLLTFPIAGRRRFIIPFIAVFIGYAINVIRVAAMAILVTSKNLSAFDYWHTGQGSLWVGAIAITLFCSFYLFLISNQSLSHTQSATPEKNVNELGRIR